MRGTASRPTSNIGLRARPVQATAPSAGSFLIIIRWRPGARRPIARDLRTSLVVSTGALTLLRGVMGPRIRGDDVGGLHRHLAVQDRRAGGEAFGGVDDGVGVDAIGTIEVIDGAGLAESFDTQRF